MAGAGFGAHFATIFRPIAGEYDLIGKHPDAAHTVRSVVQYESTVEEMRSLIAPELELIDSRILSPTKEFQSILKTIRKTITKRDHKVRQHDGFRVARLLTSNRCSSRIMTGSTTR